ncbi:MAG: hypothetical protein V9F00_10795 [Nocardioides sp.]
MVLTRVGRAASACAGLLLLREAWLWWTDGRNFLAELTVSGEAPDLPGGPPSLLELGLVIALFAVGVLHLRRLAWSVFVTTTLLVLTAATVWLRLWWIFRDGFQLASVTSAARVFLLEPGWDSMTKRFDLAVLVCLLAALSLLYAAALSPRAAEDDD